MPLNSPEGYRREHFLLFLGAHDTRLSDPRQFRETTGHTPVAPTAHADIDTEGTLTELGTDGQRFV